MLLFQIMCLTALVQHFVGISEWWSDLLTPALKEGIFQKKREKKKKKEGLIHYHITTSPGYDGRKGSEKVLWDYTAFKSPCQRSSLGHQALFTKSAR